MTAFAGEFVLPRLERVISGLGCVASLGDELKRLGRSRAVVVTGKTLGASPLLARLEAAMDGRCAGMFTHSRQHVPSVSVCELIKTVEELQADCLVSFGGGSPIDTAKIAIHKLVLEQNGDVESLLHIAIPTTLSAGEYTLVAGVTDEKSRIKRSLFDPRLAPRTTIVDPEVTLETPDWLWAASGIRALDHAVESSYSVRHHPLSDALASKAIATLLRHLPLSMTDNVGDRLEHRSGCLMAAWLAVFGMTNAGFGVSHAFGHQIGPRWDVPHGVTSCIMLPHAMRFMADRAAERFGPIAEGFGVDFDAGSPHAAAARCADLAEQFIAQFGLPQRLRDAGVPREQIGEVAAIVHAGMERAQAVASPVSQSDLLALIERAY